MKRLIDLRDALLGSRTSKSGLILVLIILGMALFSDALSPYDPKSLSGMPYETPSIKHPMGTDDIGHDLLSQLIYGSRTSLLVGVLSALGVTIIGVAVGLVSGFIGGAVDEILMRLTDIVLVIPYIVFIIVLVSYLGPSIWNMIISISLLGWPSIARMVRSHVLSLKKALYIEAAEALGAGNMHIMVKHVLPSLTPLVAPIFVLTVMDGILAEAGLSFLGLGDPNSVSWGMMLYYAQVRGAFIRKMWWWILPPGLMITFTSLSFLLLGMGLEEKLNPRLRRL